MAAKSKENTFMVLDPARKNERGKDALVGYLNPTNGNGGGHVFQPAKDGADLTHLKGREIDPRQSLKEQFAAPPARRSSAREGASRAGSVAAAAEQAGNDGLAGKAMKLFAPRAPEEAERYNAEVTQMRRELAERDPQVLLRDALATGNAASEAKGARKHLTANAHEAALRLIRAELQSRGLEDPTQAAQPDLNKSRQRGDRGHGM